MPQTAHLGLASAQEADKTKVFVSYSRKDSDFVERLVVALEAQKHIDVFRDTDDILPTEEWKGRLERLIGEADTVVFCLSPDSASSDICRWEAEIAERLNKRIAPLVVRDVTGHAPAALAKLNYIYFTKSEEFERALGNLVAALDADIGWIREHTRLGELSRRWERSGRPRDQLLRGIDLAAAEGWMARRPRNAPAPTEISQSYIAASRIEAAIQARRRWWLQVFVGTLIVSMVVGAAAWFYDQQVKEGIYWLTRVRGHVQTAAMVRALKPQQPFRDCLDCPEMIVVPAGEFMMGSPDGEGEPDERPQRKVTIKHAFAVSRFEIAFEEWDVCANRGDCDDKISASGWGRNVSARGWGRGRQPAINLAWDDAKRYVAWLTRITGQPYRLLSEAEWEYAARAGTTTNYSWGNEIGQRNANCIGCGGDWNGKQQAAPTGTFPPNAFGLHDMHGNVEEWVEDCGEPDYKSAPVDGAAVTTGDCRRRMLRGGSWAQGPPNLRSARRGGATPTDWRAGMIGFRIARTLQP